MVTLPSLPESVKTYIESFDFKSNIDIQKIWSDESSESLKKFKKIVKDHLKVNQFYTCVYCRQQYKIKNNKVWDLEHIAPKKSNPSWIFELKNLCVICSDCNQRKSDKKTLINDNLKKYPTSGDAFIIFHPHFENYEDHLIVIEPAKFYIAKTPKGVKTYDTVGLSRFFLMLGDLDINDKTNDLLMIRLAQKLSETKDGLERGKILNYIESLVIDTRARSLAKVNNKEIENLLAA